MLRPWASFPRQITFSTSGISRTDPATTERSPPGQNRPLEPRSALGGRRSLGAVLIEGTFVCRKKYPPNIGPLLDPGCKRLQPSRPRWMVRDSLEPQTPNSLPPTKGSKMFDSRRRDRNCGRGGNSTFARGRNGHIAWRLKFFYDATSQRCFSESRCQS